MTGLTLYYDLHLIAKDSVAAVVAPSRITTWLVNVQTRRPNSRIIIGIERYQLGGNTVKKTRQSDPVELLGVAKLLARAHKNVEVLISNASDAKKIGSPDTLKRIGWWTTGHDHINDAASQVLRVLAAVRPTEFAQVVGL